jgi:hypothetical protein
MELRRVSYRVTPSSRRRCWKRRIGRSDGLDADLVELAEAPLLGPLLPERGPEIEELPEVLLREEALLDEDADDRRRQFGAERERLLVVPERVHLLLDDVGHLAGGLVEELGVFEDRRAHLLVAVAAEDAAHRLFDLEPERDALREDVLGSGGGAEGHRQRILWGSPRPRKTDRRQEDRRP